MSNREAISPQTEITPAGSVDNWLSNSGDIYDEPLQQLPVQCKLSIGPPDDPMEHKADAVADKIMRMPQKNLIQRKCAHCEEEEKLQRKSLSSFIQKKESEGGTMAGEAVSSKIYATSGNGQVMDSSTLSFMQTRFGEDFSNVNIHTGNDATAMNRELSAKAFTVGNDIYFNEGQYQPASDSGKHLLAHELTHTIQQSNAAPRISKQPKTTAPPSSALIETVVDEVHEAADGPGTDEEGIFMALQKLYKNTTWIAQANDRYNQKYGMTMEDELRDEMSGSELKYGLELMGIADKDPLITKLPVTDAEYKQAAKRLEAAMPHSMFGWGTDEETVFAVLLPFEGKLQDLKKLKLVYREITGRVIREDLRYEMSGSELSYALYLINDTESGTTLELEAMYGKDMQWRSSIFFPCKDSIAVSGKGEPVKDDKDKEIKCTSFGIWASSPGTSPPPAFIDTTIINCWEVILLSAYNAGEIPFSYIHDLYSKIPECKPPEYLAGKERMDACNKERSGTWVTELAYDDLTVYRPHDPASPKPRRGDIVFFNRLEHVALATGTGSKVLTFWPAPDTAFLFTPAGTVKDKVKIVTIEDLYDWWKKEKKEEPKIEFAHSEW